MNSLLPITMQLLADLRKSEGPESPCSTSGPVKVLIVEDDQDDAILMCRTLQDVGCEVSVLVNGADAIREIADNPNKYCIVFLDLNLPGVDGVQVIRQAKKINAMIHFIIVTGSDRLCEIPRDCYYGVVRKPLHYEIASEILSKLSKPRV